jgi:quaternary ammonium compound-resistance protein SugE
MSSAELIKAGLLMGLAVMGNTGASLALKWASQPGRRVENLTESFNLVNVVGLFIALSCYGIAFVAYMFALRSVPVSTAYPLITSLSVVLIIISARVFFEEPITLYSMVGTLFVLVGVFILMRASH